MRYRLALFFLALTVLPQGPPSRAEDYFAQEKCSLCHIRQSVFFDPRFTGPEKLKEFNEERLCSSCHNGSVRDSRVALWRGAQHPSPATGEKASGKRCSGCHSPHAKGGWEVLAGTSVSLRKGGDAVCAGCHPKHRPGAGGIHGKGFPEGGCRECHQAHGGAGKSLLREAGETLCLRCHAEVAAKKSGGHPLSGLASGRGTEALPECTACHPVHRDGRPAPYATARCGECHTFGRRGKEERGKGHPGEANCLECHSFHAKSGEGGRRFRGREIGADVLCARCHEDQRADTVKKGREKGTHVALLSGTKEDICFRCHRIHRPAPGTALLVSGKAYSCLECHEEQNTIREVGGIDLAHPVFERVEKKRLLRAAQARKLQLGPSGEIICGTCHAVHRASRNTPLLNTRSEGGENCFWCHEEMRGKRHAPRAETGKGAGCETCHPIHGKRNLGDDPWKKVCMECHEREGVHRPERVDGASRTSRDLPGFDARGRKVAIGRISCPTCHEPHGTVERKSRLRRDYSPSGFLCTACHREKESVALTPHDLRGIAGKSICEPCHLPHGGLSPWMRGREPGSIEAWEDACRACHKEKGLGDPVPRGGHPVNIVVPRPLPAIYPLYDAEGKRQRSGVMSCPTCHEAHGMGVLPAGQGTGKLLRGDCLSCHPEKKMSHGKADCSNCHPPHEEKKPADACGACHPGAGNGVARVHLLAGKSCNACHRLHPGEKGEEPAEGRCASCHTRAARIGGTPHAELGGGACQPCHPAHRNLEVPLMKRRAWEDVFAADMPCLRCHNEGGPWPLPQWAEHPKSRKKVHTTYGATVTIESPIPMNGRLQEAGRPLFPFFDDDGKPSLSGRMGCLTCHDPHAGTILKGEGERRSAAGYLRDPSGVFLAEICAACHQGDAGEHARRFHELPRKTD